MEVEVRPLCQRPRRLHGLTWAREHLSAHPASPPPLDRRAAVARARAAQSRFARLPALRGPVHPGERVAVGSRAVLGRRPRHRRQRASRSRCARRDPVRDPGREGRAGLQRAPGTTGVVQRALRALRASVPGLVLVTDVCLCEYTSHGLLTSSRRRSRTTPRSSCWPGRRSAMSKPGPTPSRPAT